MNYNWRKGITEEMNRNGETWDDIQICTLFEEELDEVFDNDDDVAVLGKPFTVWTNQYVYFPIFVTMEGVGSVSRNPNGKATYHIGWN